MLTVLQLQRTDNKKDTAIKIRKNVLLSDRNDIYEIVKSTNMFNDEEINIAVELFDEWQVKGSASGYNFLFAIVDGKVAGYTCFGPIPGSMQRYEIYWIAVHKQYQGAGIGKTLISSTEEEIIKKGGERSYIETSSRQEYSPTHKFYLGTGYNPVAELLDYFRDGDGKIIFMKNLSGKKGSSLNSAGLEKNNECKVLSVAG